ncbi:MAG: ABC transporter permease [Cyanobacteria bacterium P01_H01_bin.74]
MTMPENNTQLFPMTRGIVQVIATESVVFIEMLGQAARNTAEMMACLLRFQFNLRHYLKQAAFVGFDTLGIALIMTTFTGMVIALQVAKEMVRQGAGDYVGALVAVSLVRELGPIMTTFAVTAMACSAYAAELSTMNITSQTDALKTLHVSPIRYLLMPRVLAGITMLPLISIVTIVSGLLGGLLISYLMADIGISQFMDSVQSQIALRDIVILLVKTMISGFVIFVISTTIGLASKGGAKDVGNATTRAVVWSFTLTALLDYLFTYLLYGLY